MANDLTGVSLWKLDTAGSIATQSVRIAKLVLEPANPEDYALIKDQADGKLIAKLKAGSDTSTLNWIFQPVDSYLASILTPFHLVLFCGFTYGGKVD